MLKPIFPDLTFSEEFVTSLHGDPEWEAIWSVIRTWDIERARGYGYHGATGTDVTYIYQAIKAARESGE